jgi:hypothetical protein
MFSKIPARLSALLLLALIGLSALSIWLTGPPPPKPATAPSAAFSAARAMIHVRQIARQPHAIGTPDHPRVRAYLLGALRGLGLQPQVQETVIVGPLLSSGSLATSGSMLANSSKAAYVYNVLCRIPGRQPAQAGPRKAVLLMAHYDSQPNTPGAADDGAGVAAILETARALQQSGPLAHDVILLLTDGEEYGLFGAKAFLKHPWARDAAVVMNVEARGNSGPSMTFELSPENGWLVEQLAAAAPHPLANSLMYEVYKQLPNSTDFTPFSRAGYAGMNSAITDGFVHYHKLTDSPDNLNINSLQHHGDNLLGLTRHIANGSLDAVTAPDRVFFNGAGHWLIHYPAWLNTVWMVLLTLAFGAALLLGHRQQALAVGQVLAGLGLFVLLPVVAGGLCLGLNTLVAGALPLHHFFNGSYGAVLFAGGYSLLTIGVFGAGVWLALRWLRPLSLVLGAYSLLFGLTAASYFFFPAATCLLLFPLLFGLAGLLAGLWQTRLGAATSASTVRALPLLAGTLPTVFVLLPMVWLLFVIFDIQLPVLPVVLLGVALALLLPLWLLIDSGLHWRGWPLLPIIALLTGAALLLVAIRREEPGVEKPLSSQLSYFLNADTRQARWASYYLDKADDWNRQFLTKPTYGKLTEIYPNGHITTWNQYLKSPAPPIADAPPVATVLSDVTTGPVRQLTLDLHSVRGAAHLEAGLFPKPSASGRAVSVLAVRLNGEPVPIKAEQTPDGPACDLMVFGLPVSKHVTLSIDLEAGSALRLRLYDQSVGLPGQLVKTPRPAWVEPEQGPRNNLTVIGKTYTF